jgi:hypothetical protein
VFVTVWVCVKMLTHVVYVSICDSVCWNVYNTYGEHQHFFVTLWIIRVPDNEFSLSMLGCMYNDEWLTIYMYDRGKYSADWA